MSPSLWESVAFGAIYWHEDWMDVDKILQIFAKKVEPPCGSGKLADYIPARASVDPDKFGMAIATEDGACDTIGDAQECLSIQSISKVFTFSPVLRKAGDERRKWVGREHCGIGLPGKNDVGGSVLAIAPGEGAVAVWSPGPNGAGASTVGAIASEALVAETVWSIFG